MVVVEPGVYEHFKGKRYLVVGLGLHTEGDGHSVIYRPLYPCEHLFFIRPLSSFCETVAHAGKVIPRFKKVGVYMHTVEESILLASDLFHRVVSGDKKVTLRKGKRIFSPDLTITNRDTLEHILVSVTSVECRTVATAGQDVLFADGFGSIEEAVALMQRFYPDLTADDDISIVRFKLKG